ncbi:hypothetical protein LV84_02339 [Algoriphagus ratkowskyi]|uniref:Uncharacterized protein n=1 Tax=Algoriphagus ratkowskyi TaxID=57028 RepID=A0A2W7RA08_9BACT|nr:hypothetical protein [Algoriphagus ratkowskyi]PZX55976.1 hypothetical protein LV84_02339 [Algoriphagus ratkowskyi]TXD77211.1 hypothetical protein ESW18_13025 [Algoriphagus ratkowskyi]
MKKFLSVIILCFPLISFAQKAEKKLEISPDVHFRMFWMSTSYPETYKDDYALGTSFHMGTKLTYAENWDFRIGYRVFGNLWSSDLTAADPTSGGVNRYEVGLFDLLDLDDRFFGKLENLSLTYSKNNWGISAGRMAIDEDWINAQDGRLSPTGVEGAKVWLITEDKWNFTAWGIGKMSVRGTSEWLSVGQSIGVFPGGRNPDGEASLYAGNTESNWIGIAELSKEWEGLSIRASNTLVQNVSTTFWAQTEKRWVSEESGITWLWGLQAGFQAGLGDGGNLNPIFQYKNPEDRNWAISTRFGYKKAAWHLNLNYTKTGGEGIWLSPREWGKDAWYTFIPRERNEGFSSLNALTLFAEYSVPRTKLKAFAHLGLHWLPALNAPSENKYNMPSYRQINLGMKYSPESIPKFDFQLLVMNKEALGNQSLKPGQEYNKVRMVHVNGILNWRWN